MKNLLIILTLAVMASSCNPLISKDLRRKNKCNRKVERELKRHKKKIAKIAIDCPEIMHSDTIRDTIEVFIPEVRLDSFLIIEKDTAMIDSLFGLIENNETREVIREYFTKYIPIKDTVTHLMDGYTIKFWATDGKINYTVDKPEEIIEAPVEIIIEKVKAIELAWYEKLMNNLSRPFVWIVVFVILFILYRILKKYLPFIK